MITLTKAELVLKVLEQVAVPKKEALQMVDLLFEEIICALEANETVKLPGLGNFEPRDKKQRPGYNPRTGESVPVSARRVVVFHPGVKLKKRVQSWSEE